MPLVGIVTHGLFTTAHERTPEQADTAHGFCFQAMLWYTRQQGHIAVFTFSSFDFPSTKDSCNQRPLKPTCFDAMLRPRRL